MEEQQTSEIVKENEIPNMKWIEKISSLMDSQFQIPGTKFRFGLDPILGLIPFAGDVSGFAISGMLVYLMLRHGASKKVIIMMMGNIILDATIGSIPLLGSIFDFGFKANKRNINILKKHYTEGKYQGSGTGIIIAVLLGFFIIIGFMFYGVWKLIQYIF